MELLKEPLEMVSRREIRELLNEAGNTKISLYLPTHRMGKEIRQDSIRLKNMLKQAEKELRAKDMSLSEIDHSLEPARELVHQESFWRYQGDSLALFLSEGAMRPYRLPMPIGERVHVAERFLVKPLVPLLGLDRDFMILALSQNRIRVFRVTHWHIEEMHFDNVPGNIGEALPTEDPERVVQYHSYPMAGPGTRSPIYHGHGGDSQHDSRDLYHRFLRKLDHELTPHLSEESLPLVFMGVEDVFHLYREVNTYPFLLDDFGRGNPDDMNAKQVLDATRGPAENHFLKEKRDAQEQLERLAGTEMGAVRVEDVVPAAHEGKVESLFVNPDEARWGRFDESNYELELHSVRQEGDDDLVDYAVAQCLQHGGDAFAMEAIPLASGSPLAAVFRY